MAFIDLSPSLLYSNFYKDSKILIYLDIFDSGQKNLNKHKETFIFRSVKKKNQKKMKRFF